MKLRKAMAELILIAVLTGTGLAQDIDLANYTNGFPIYGANLLDGSGISVSGAGDVNGDGLADLIIGANGGDTPASNTGEAYVLFGKSDHLAVDLGSFSGGFRIDGEDSFDEAGISVSGAGDVNGDGLMDLIIGAHQAEANGGTFVGVSYVVFGKTDEATVALGQLGSGGFRIEGVDSGDRAGRSVSGAGDVNGDGLADLIVGAPFADPSGQTDAGESYVVFGKPDVGPVLLSNLGSAGFQVNGELAGDNSGTSVAGAGDVNGDGLADVIIGAPDVEFPENQWDAGRAYVVFGKSDSNTVDLAALGTGGFLMNSGFEDSAGTSVAGAGDMNDDGLADLLIGRPGFLGQASIVFGKADSLDVELRNPGTGGFRIFRPESGGMGFSVAGAGDYDGDGRSDLAIGAPFPSAESDTSQAHLVFGKGDATPVESANFSLFGFFLGPAPPDDRVGTSVSGAGDVNGDGLADLIIGAPDSNPLGRTGAGTSYVVFSPASVPLQSTYRARARNGNPPRVAVGISGDGSNDSHPDSRAWIDFADGAEPFSPASQIAVTLTRNSGVFPTPAASVSWQILSDRLDWTIAEVTFRYLDTELIISNEPALQIVYSADGGAPFTPLASVVNPLNNTITASVDAFGFFYLGEAPLDPFIFSDGFE